MQFGECDLGRRSFGFVLVVHLDAGRNAATVIDDRDRIIGMNRDDDIVAMTGQGFVDRIVDNLEHQVMQTGAIGCIADVHARAFANRLKSFENLD